MVYLAFYSDSGNVAGMFISTPVQRKQPQSVCARDGAEDVDCVKKIDSPIVKTPRFLSKLDQSVGTRLRCTALRTGVHYTLVSVWAAGDAKRKRGAGTVI